jgi:hypothetical protein
MKFSQQHCNNIKPNTLAGFEPGIFSSVGGRDDHYIMPRRHEGNIHNISA